MTIRSSNVYGIYYFTGTGNSLSIAKQVADGLKGEIELKNIADALKMSVAESKKEIEVKGNDSRVAIVVFPVYYWGLPLGVLKFIENHNWEMYSAVYAIATNGGLPGKALEQMADVLYRKGIHLDGGFLIQMPGNYIVNYSAFPDRYQNRLLRRSRVRTNGIIEIIRKGEKYPIEKGGLFIDRIFSKCYYAGIEDFREKDSRFNIDSDCISCGVCQKVCRFDNISLVEGKPSWQHRCEQCMACIQWCPHTAINYGSKTQTRKRYHHPMIGVKDIMAVQGES